MRFGASFKRDSYMNVIPCVVRKFEREVTTLVDVTSEGRSLVERFFFSEEPMLKRIAVLAFILVALLGAIVVLESAAGIITIGRLERKLNILKELTLLGEPGFRHHADIDSMLYEVAADLKAFTPDLGQTVSKIIPERNDNIAIEIPAALSSWLIIALYLLFKGDGGWKMRVTLCALTLITGSPIAALISEFIETPNGFWSVVLTFLLGLIPLTLFGRYFYLRNQRQKQEVKKPNRRQRTK